MKTASLFIVTLIALGSRFATADPKEFYYQRRAQGLDPVDTRAVELLTFEQRTNPEDPHDTRTFQQRFYRNSQYASGPAAPVLFYLCGEATCQPSALRGAIEEHAKAVGAH